MTVCFIWLCLLIRVVAAGKAAGEGGGGGVTNNDTENLDRSDTEGGCSCAVK